MKYLIIYLPIAAMLLSCSRETIIEPVDDGIPPNAPAELKVYYSSDGEIGIEWFKNNEPGIDFYNVYRAVNDSTNLKIIGKTASDYYTDVMLDYDSTYFYSVAAVDIFGRSSPLSNTVSAKPVNKYKPYPPNNITINARNWYDTLSIFISWYLPIDSDIKGFEIYRSVENNFDLSKISPIAFISGNNFIDTTGLEILTEYYYVILSVDKGELRSNNPPVVSDMIYDRPVLVYPLNNAELDYFSEFQIKSISVPAEYKLIVQRNKLFDVIYEKKFSLEEINSIYNISFNSLSLEAYKDYFWRVVTYSGGNSEANSFSDLFSFKIVP